MNFPSLCVDNFFTSPLKIVELSKKLPFHDCKYFDSSFPGKRTAPLKHINEDLYKEISEKILSIFYPLKTILNLHYDIAMHFQVIDPKSYGHINTGWIHRDESLASGVIYLNADIESEAGTSIFAPIDINLLEKTKELNHIKNEQYKNFEIEKLSYYENALNKHNSFFRETTRFNNVFNRLVLFDGRSYHGVPSFSINEPRLTLVFFINSLGVYYFPTNHLKNSIV